jgi:hypothetical protein
MGNVHAVQGGFFKAYLTQSHPSPAQTLLRVAGSTTARRHAHLDQPVRAVLHHDPVSQLLFPSLCKPTAPVSVRTNLAGAHTNRGLMMPRRTTTRAHDRAKRIETERARNRQIRENLENTRDGGHSEGIWDDPYFPSRPRSPDETDLRRFDETPYL